MHHTGLQHEEILHSLAHFYFDTACDILSKYEPLYWAWASTDKPSHRALKYLGKKNTSHGAEAFKVAWQRLRDVSASMGDTFTRDLHADMDSTITTIDRQIEFLANEGRPSIQGRQQAVFHAQLAPYAKSTEGRAYAQSGGCPAQSGPIYFSWMTSNFKAAVSTDPIPGWQRRVTSLKDEPNKHAVLKKYCEFMNQTELVRSQIEEAAGDLDEYIQLQVDIARGK